MKKSQFKKYLKSEIINELKSGMNTVTDKDVDNLENYNKELKKTADLEKDIKNLKEEIDGDTLFDIFSRYIEDPNDVENEISNYQERGWNGLSDILTANLGRDDEWNTLVQIDHDEETLRREIGEILKRRK